MADVSADVLQEAMDELADICRTRAGWGDQCFELPNPLT